jgi:hypothetical protein
LDGCIHWAQQCENCVNKPYLNNNLGCTQYWYKSFRLATIWKILCGLHMKI